MLDLSRLDETALDPLRTVVASMVSRVVELDPTSLMVVGAWCRDALHAAQGHLFATAATRDLDLAIGLSTWDVYQALSSVFPRVGHTGIRHRIDGYLVDLVPFGAIEDPRGLSTPPSRGEDLSVWSFEEIYASSLPLPLSDSLSVRVPTVAGYAAAKLAAWLDRSAWHETKDAGDLALCAFWYSESQRVVDRLYETPEGRQVLSLEDADLRASCVHLLARDVVRTIGDERTRELLDRWPGDIETLTRHFVVRGATTGAADAARRRELLAALTRGLRARLDEPATQTRT